MSVRSASLETDQHTAERADSAPLTLPPQPDLYMELLTSDDVLGEIALMDPGPATATVTATEVGSLVVLARDALEVLAFRSPALAAALLGELARATSARIRRATGELDRARGLPAAEKTETGWLAALRGLFGGGR